MSNIASVPDGAGPKAPPWWRFPIVWFALSGPALVIVAGSATMVLAYRHADVVLVETPTATSPRSDARAAAPALQARNHAATPATRP
ncbi:MAG: nitrogen fixation protein FixH [Caldimonas sp.]